MGRGCAIGGFAGRGERVAPPGVLPRCKRIRVTIHIQFLLEWCPRPRGCRVMNIQTTHSLFVIFKPDVMNLIFTLVLIVLSMAGSNTRAHGLDNIAATSEPTYGVITGAALRKPGPIPRIDISNCSYIAQGTQGASTFEDLAPLVTALHASGSDHARWLLREELIPMAWFMRHSQSMTLESAATAVHEATHYARRRLSSCAAGKQVFVLGGKVYKTGLQQGLTRHMSFAADFVPKGFPAERSFRFRKYLREFSHVIANQFPTLLDELVAYTSGAEITLLFIKNSSSPITLRAEIESYDGDVSGASELLLFCFSYLRGLRQVAPFEFDELINTEGVLELLRAVWGFHGRMMALTNSLNPPEQRRIAMSRAAIDAIYSPEFEFIRGRLN
jgi:hypothetical protein